MAFDFDVFTHANGAFLYDVFNGVASIFGHGSYMTAMATCMTAASIGIMISAVLQGRMVNLLWMIQAIFLYMVLLLGVWGAMERRTDLRTFTGWAKWA